MSNENSNPVSVEEMQAMVTALQAEVAKLKAEKAAGVGKVSLKVSEKGALSLYGMGRFPVTLYKGQWETIFAQKETIEKFIADNGSKLKNKEDESDEERKARLARVAAYEAETKAKVAANNAKNATNNVG